MEMLLRSAEDIANKNIDPSMKAFMDDVTLATKLKSLMEQLLDRLQELFKWAALKIKPSKCRSLAIIKSIYKDVKFAVDGNAIPTILEKGVKSLFPTSNWSTSLEGYKKQLGDGLHSIDESGLLDKEKVWCLYFGLIPKILWPLQIYEVSLTQVEAMERLITKYIKNGGEYLSH